MSLVIIFTVIIGFYLSKPKEVDSIDRVRNYGFVLLVAGISLWAWLSIFSGQLLIPRWLDIRYALEDEAQFIVKFISIMGLVQFIIGVIFRCYWPREH